MLSRSKKAFPDRSPTGDRTLSRLGDRTWIYRGFFSNSGVLEFKDECVLIDSQVSPRAGALVRTRIEQQIRKPVSHILLTHHHGDHCGGLAAFPEAQVWAARETSRLMVERDDHRKRYADAFGLVVQDEHPTLAPNRFFEDRTELEVGGERLEIFFAGKAETEDAHVIWCPSRRAVAVGDGVPAIDYPFMGTPFLDEGLHDDGEWIRYLKTVRGLGADILIPGHGPALIGRSVIEARIDLLIALFTDLLEATREAMRRGMSVRATLKFVDAKLGRYRAHPGLRERTLCQKFAVYRCINSLDPERKGRGWWDELRPSAIPRLAETDLERFRTVLGDRAALAELVTNPFVGIPRKEAIALLRAAPCAGTDAFLQGLLSKLLFWEGLKTRPTVEGSELLGESYRVAKRALELDPAEPKALLYAGALETLGVLVLVQDSALPREHLLGALAGDKLSPWDRRAALFWLGKLAQLDGLDRESDRYYRQALGAWALPVFPALRSRLRSTP